MVKALSAYEELVKSGTDHLDRVRIFVLSGTMRNIILRKIYSVRALRLGAYFALASMFYLPIAFRFPQMLLVWGPVIFGFPHLISSYRYLRKERILANFTNVQTLGMLTVLTTVALFVISKLSSVPTFPYGFLEITAVACAIVIVQLFASVSSVPRALICIGLLMLLLYLVWLEPLIFLAATLVLHNWVAFLFWIRSAKSFTDKFTALFATLVFGIFHYVVFMGWTDVWMPIEGFHAKARSTGWVLGSWSDDHLVWDRMVVLYAFGLSIHYFIWLKAIPETGMKMEWPNSFAKSFRCLRQDIGDKTLILVSLVAFATLATYAISTALGSQVYFAIAALHGWIEISALVLGAQKSHKAH